MTLKTRAGTKASLHSRVGRCSDAGFRMGSTETLAPTTSAKKKGNEKIQSGLKTLERLRALILTELQTSIKSRWEAEK